MTERWQFWVRRFGAPMYNLICGCCYVTALVSPEADRYEWPEKMA